MVRGGPMSVMSTRDLCIQRCDRLCAMLIRVPMSLGPAAWAGIDAVVDELSTVPSSNWPAITGSDSPGSAGWSRITGRGGRV